MEKRFNLETSILTDDLLFPEGPIYLNDGSILLVEIARGTLTKVYQNGKKEIISIYKNAKPNDLSSISSKLPSKYVLEVIQGVSDNLNLKIGDRINYQLI